MTVHVFCLTVILNTIILQGSIAIQLRKGGSICHTYHM